MNIEVGKVYRVKEWTNFESNIRSLLITLLEQDRLTCEVCSQLGINDYCQSRDCVETIIEWAKEEGK